LYYWTDKIGGTCGITDYDISVGNKTWNDVKACYDSQGFPNLGDAIEDGVSANLIIEQNIIVGNGTSGGAGINLASVKNSTVRNNLVYANFAAAIVCWDNNYANDMNFPANQKFGCGNVKIVNNTLVDSTGNRGSLIIREDAVNMNVHNNIIVRARSDAYEVSSRSGAGLNSGHNYYYAQYISSDSTGWVLIDSSPGSGSITGFTVAQALAQFVNPGSGDWVLEGGIWPTLNPSRPDYRPIVGSTLLTAGSADYCPPKDLFNVTRGANEIGALTAAP
jgi:hypothetical protein